MRLFFLMKQIQICSIALASFLAIFPGAWAGTEPDSGQIAISVGRLLEQGHYSKRKLDDDLSRQLLKNYLETLDYNHLFFTQRDVDAFTTKYATALDDDILLGNPNPAFEIYDLYAKRVEERIAKVKEMVKQDFDFTGDESIEINRQKAPWPKDDSESEKLRTNRVKGEFLQEKLSEHPIDPPVKILTRRYDQTLRNLHEQTREDVVKFFLTTLAQTYDPHSEYMSKSELENFSINMRLSLVGIGAVLRSEDGYAKVMELVPGGPAQVDGHLKVSDRISAVAQGDAEFVDTVGMKLDKVVEMIRGKKGTRVRMQVVPAHAADPSARKIVEIVRDEIKLKEQEAKAEVIEKESSNGGAPHRLGWITLPSFYADMEHSGAKGAKSTTKDVLLLLNRLKQENIGGLVIDLRRNGGGSLEEAVNLTGLFIKKGPVVQAKDASGNIHVSRDRDATIAYDGPMVVLTNRLSASASEIFAAALQDYGRAVIVGDQATFGKGTVQTMLEIGRFIPFLGSDSNDAGALKLTIQKFYRIAGGSTQLRGVVSDVKLPSAYDHPEIGEGSLKAPMAYDEVAPAPFEKILDHPLFLKELKLRSAARVATDREFRWITDDLNSVKRRIASNKVSLNESTRRGELAEEKTKREKRIAEREKRKQPEQKIYQLTLDDVGKPELQLVKNEKKPASVDEGATMAEDDEEEESITAKKPEVDPVHNETINILGDLIELSRAPKTASVK
ncbi:MAG: carboxyl-terminal processing protease [Chthoniobacter sp.]|nr:carboxyl-terminal processing protease [Chthoniobacter sp.]